MMSSLAKARARSANHFQIREHMKVVMRTFACALVAILSLCACGSGNGNLTESGLDPVRFDTTLNGKIIQLYVLKNEKMEVCVTNLGARIVSITVPNRNGAPTDVVLGFDNVAQYADSVNSPNDFGAIIGRYANHIGKRTVSVGGKKTSLQHDDCTYCVNSKPCGWQYQVFDGVQPNDTTLKLTLLSPDGENNLQGNVKATITYTVKSDNTLDMVIEATTDAETVASITNRSYFNVSGDPSKAGTNMILYINADKFTPIDSTLTATGELREVYGTPLDFTKRHALYETIGDTSFEQIGIAGGYNHNWCLNTYKEGQGDDNKVAASLYSPESGIYLAIYTNEPGIHVYTGNLIDGSLKGKKGIAYPKQASVCFETQKYPDSPNNPKWPSPYLKPDGKYHSHTAYKFSIKEN